MGKLLPVPYPGQSMSEYREQLVNFQKNYWSFLKPSKGGSKFIPLPPEHLKPKEMRPNIIPAIVASNKRKNEKKMSSKKLSEHVEEELFNKEKRVIPSVDPKKVIKTTPKIVKESVLGSVEPKMDKEYTFGSVPPPVKKKKPYYRKKYNKPKPVEVVIPESTNPNTFVRGFVIGVIVGIILTSIIETIIN
jgi:hypothetical protein